MVGAGCWVHSGYWVNSDGFTSVCKNEMRHGRWKVVCGPEILGESVFLRFCSLKAMVHTGLTGLWVFSGGCTMEKWKTRGSQSRAQPG